MRPDCQHAVNYTIVALIGMLAGFIIGYVFGQGAPAPTIPSMPHPRMIEPRTQ